LIRSFICHATFTIFHTINLFLPKFCFVVLVVLVVFVVYGETLVRILHNCPCLAESLAQ
jgi:hypothetical protein